MQTKSTIAAPKLTFETNEFYLRDSAEMVAAFAEWPEAVASTLEIAERCSVELELGKQLIPSYPTPDGSDERAYLRERVERGPARCATATRRRPRRVERMEMELERDRPDGLQRLLPDRLGLRALRQGERDRGRSRAAARRRARSSPTAWRSPTSTRSRYDLLFERFLNPERVSMPDIDIDFSVRGRERVMRYVTEKYGRESVAQIVTFGKMFPRAATRDAARVLGFDYATGDRLAKLIPDPIMGRAPSFEDCLRDGQPLRKAYDDEPDARQIVDVAKGLEGIVRNSSIHAAAVVIADRPLTDIVPLQLADAGTDESGERVFRTVTQFSMKPIEQIGLLKMDFLGLRNLDVIEDALDIIERSTGAAPGHDDAAARRRDDLRDARRAATRRACSSSSPRACARRCKKVRPDEFNDLVALNALYRPGAMDQIPVYAKGKHNPQAISYADERLRPILESSKGVILYQEQAMQISKELAGFSGAKADDLRKAIGKKNRAAMAALKPEFVEGCRASGTRPEVIEFLWQTNEKSADYSFNKSHAACYALIAYRTAWLKANYPAEYMAALISSVMSTKDKVPFFVARCEEMGIEILPPDVNLSDHEFTVGPSDGRQHPLRPGRGQGRRLPGRRGDQAGARGRRVLLAVGLLRARRLPDGQQEGDRGADQVRRVRLHRRHAQGHARRAREGAGQRPAGAAGRDDRPGLDLRPRRSDAAGQPAGGGLRARAPADPRRGVRAARAARRREGGDRPVHLRAPAEAAAKRCCARAPTARSPRLPERRDKEQVTVGGIITETKRIRTRNGDHMMFATLDDLAGSVEMLVFGKALGEYESLLARRRDRAREGPRRPQGSRQHLPDRGRGAALRPLRGGDRAGAPEGERGGPPARGGRRAARSAAGARAGPLPEGDRGPQAGLSGLSRAQPTCAWSSSSRTARAAGCASATSTGSRTRRRCGPSSSSILPASSRAQAPAAAADAPAAAAATVAV